MNKFIYDKININKINKKIFDLIYFMIKYLLNKIF